MPSVRQHADPLPLRQALAELLALSDERDTWLRRLDATYRAALRAGYVIGVVTGRRQVLDEEAASRRAAAGFVRASGEYARVEDRRWARPGERAGSRATFGQPVPGDYPGRGAA